MNMRDEHARPRAAATAAEPAQIPVRGVPLKVVSLFTMAFAILCLSAFLVGRTTPPDRAAVRDTKLFAPQTHANGISIPPGVAEARE
jgi:hypothetical protein